MCPETPSNSGGSHETAAVTPTRLSPPADAEELRRPTYRWKVGHLGLKQWVTKYFVGSKLHYMFHHKSLRWGKKNNFQDKFYSCLITHAIFKIFAFSTPPAQRNYIYINPSMKDLEYMFLAKNCTRFIP